MTTHGIVRTITVSSSVAPRNKRIQAFSTCAEVLFALIVFFPHKQAMKFIHLRIPERKRRKHRIIRAGQSTVSRKTKSKRLLAIIYLAAEYTCSLLLEAQRIHIIRQKKRQLLVHLFRCHLLLPTTPIIFFSL